MTYLKGLPPVLLLMACGGAGVAEGGPTISNVLRSGLTLVPSVAYHGSIFGMSDDVFFTYFLRGEEETSPGVFRLVGGLVLNGAAGGSVMVNGAPVAVGEVICSYGAT